MSRYVSIRDEDGVVHLRDMTVWTVFSVPELRRWLYQIRPCPTRNLMVSCGNISNPTAIADEAGAGATCLVCIGLVGRSSR